MVPQCLSRSLHSWVRIAGANYLKESTIDTNETVDDFGLVVTAIHAQELLDNPVFTGVVNDLGRQIKDTIVATEFDNFNGRQNLYMLFKALQNLEHILKASASLKELVDPVIPELATHDPETEDLTKNPTED